MSKKGLLISGIVAFVLIIGTYFYLGGLNSVEYTVESVSDYNLVGVHYQGKGDSTVIEDVFFEAKAFLEDGSLKGTLTIVHYNDSTLAEEELKMFIGVKLESGTTNFPDSYERLTIPASKAIRAAIEAHNVVMPSPVSIEAKMRETAELANLQLQDFTIEQYISANLLLIDMPVK